MTDLQGRLILRPFAPEHFELKSIREFGLLQFPDGQGIFLRGEVDCAKADPSSRT